MKKKVILSSILSLAMCSSIAVGATYALFTSESQTNIAVTSGTVKVEATLSDLATYSKGKAMENGAFENGGLATLSEDEAELSLDLMTPGDTATFKINVANLSNVTVKYQTIFAVTESKGGEEEIGLVDGLAITYDGKEFSDKNESEWATLEVGENPEAIEVSVSLPEEAGNEYQTASAKLLFTVNAVQGNAAVGLVETTDDESLTAAIDAKKDYTVGDGEYAKTVVSDAVNVTINGGTFTSQVIAARNGGTVTVNDATAGSAESGGGPNIIANVSGESTVIINGGSYMTNIVLSGDGTGTVLITGGYFDCSVLYYTAMGEPVASLTITGGTFGSMMCMMQGMAGPYISEFVPDTHQVVNNADGSCTVVAK